MTTIDNQDFSFKRKNFSYFKSNNNNTNQEEEEPNQSEIIRKGSSNNKTYHIKSISSSKKNIDHNENKVYSIKKPNTSIEIEKDKQKQLIRNIKHIEIPYEDILKKEIISNVNVKDSSLINPNIKKISMIKHSSKKLNSLSSSKYITIYGENTVKVNDHHYDNQLQPSIQVTSILNPPKKRISNVRDIANKLSRNNVTRGLYDTNTNTNTNINYLNTDYNQSSYNDNDYKTNFPFPSKKILYHIQEQVLDTNPNLSNNIYTTLQVQNTYSQNTKNNNQHPKIKQSKSKVTVNQPDNKQSQRKETTLTNINIDNFTVSSQITNSIIGKYYRTYDLYGQEFSLLKIISSNSLYIERLFNHIENNNKYKNEFILNIEGVCISKSDSSLFTFNILLEPIEQDLESQINYLKSRNDYFKEEEVLFMLKSIVSALLFLQSHQVKHGNISPKSIFLSSNTEDNTSNVKLSLPFILDILDHPVLSYSQYKLLKDLLKTNEFFLSPSLHSSYLKSKFDIRHDSYKSDIYSIGMVILYSVTLSAKPLFLLRKKMDNETIHKVFNTFIKVKYSKGLLDLIYDMITPDEKKRLGLETVNQRIDLLLYK